MQLVKRHVHFKASPLHGSTFMRHIILWLITVWVLLMHIQRLFSLLVLLPNGVINNFVASQFLQNSWILMPSRRMPSMSMPYSTASSILRKKIIDMFDYPFLTSFYVLKKPGKHQILLAGLSVLSVVSPSWEWAICCTVHHAADSIKDELTCQCAVLFAYFL
jgi:hypothetical protein